MSETDFTPTVLVADDAPDVARRVSALVSEQCRVRVIGPASDGSTALDLFHAEQPQVAILDVLMPRLSGIDVLRAIRRTRSTCAVIMLTQITEPSIVAACEALGANAVLVKSRDDERLPDVVLDCIARQSWARVQVDGRTPNA